MKKSAIVLSLLFSTTSALATSIYADLSMLKKLNIPTLHADEANQVGFATVSDEALQSLSELAHEYGRCGNFEAVQSTSLSKVKADMAFLTEINNKNLNYISIGKNHFRSEPKENIVAALKDLKSSNIKDTVTWLSSYPTRYNRATDPNIHVNDFAKKLETLAATAAYPIKVDLISHTSTSQKSIRVSIKGSTRPNEFVILGGHLDSISGWGGAGKAPGADDNASGSASLYEALRVLVSQPQPQRTVEFFWYAGEESGLLGSAEIAETYKTEKKNVISVLQLDMTMFPGDGEFRITSITDFTTAWLRDYLKAINTAYLNIEILEDKCGYGCSDHASWYRRGFATLMPTEAKFNSMFHDIHTERDVITPAMSFEHSLVFSKIALIMSMDLANSTTR